MGRAMVTIFWDLGGVILVDFTQGASCHHGMLTRLKEAIFEGSVVFTLYCLTTHWSHHSEPLGTLGMKRFFLVLVVPYLARLDFQMFLKIMKHLQGLHLHNDKNVREQIKECLQDALLYHQGIDCLIYHYGQCLKRCNDYFRIVDCIYACIELMCFCCNLFIFLVKTGDLTF